MNPPSGPNEWARLQARPATASSAASTAAVSNPMEQFIWENRTTLAEVDAAGAPVPEAAHHDEEPGTHILIVSDEDQEPADSWRRQLISALHDVDRESPDSRSLPTEPPPVPPAEIERRAPIAYAPNRTVRISAPAPIVRRTPRYRIGIGLLGITATAGLLSTALSRPANIPEMAATAASAPFVTGSLATSAAETETFKPIMLNSPVLIREGQSPTAEPAVPVGPAIETVRTVPVQLGAGLTGLQTPSPAAAETVKLVEPSAAPLASSQSPRPPAAPAAALDRDSMAALITQQPASPTAPPAVEAGLSATPPLPIPKAQTKPEPTQRADKAPTARGTQISTAYEKAAPATKPRAQKRRANPERKSAQRSKTAQSSQRKQWDTRRQGLRTSAPTSEVKEVEPSTMVKLLKSLNPFASQEESQARPKKNIFE